MKQKISIVLCCITLLFVGCEEENILPDGSTFPADLTPFSEGELSFLPYNGNDVIYQRAPLYVDEFEMLYVERTTDSLVYAWDRTFFKWSTDFSLRAEFRFHYLETDDDGTYKALGIYLPYRNFENDYSLAHFEIPIDTSLIDEGYFADLITFHPTLTFDDQTWENVFEIEPFRHVNASEEGPLGFDRIYYTQAKGIVRFLHNNGRNWIIKP